MKTNFFRKNGLAGPIALYLGFICCAASSHAAAKKSDAPAQGSDSGTFPITRNGSVGSGIDVTVLVDGKRITTLLRGMRYKGTLSPGKHVITVVAEPNTSGKSPSKTEVTVEKGHTYS